MANKPLTFIIMEMEIRSTMRSTSYPLGWEQRQTIAGTDTDMEKLELIPTAGGDGRWGSHSGKLLIAFLPKVKRHIASAYGPESPLLDLYPKGLETGTQTNTCS